MRWPKLALYDDPPTQPLWSWNYRYVIPSHSRLFLMSINSVWRKQASLKKHLFLLKNKTSQRTILIVPSLGGGGDTALCLRRSNVTLDNLLAAKVSKDCGLEAEPYYPGPLVLHCVSKSAHILGVF